MATASLPNPVRAEAFDVIAASLGRTPDPDARLGDLGSEVAAHLLFRLESVFDVLIEADLVFPHATLAELAEYVTAMHRLATVFRREPAGVGVIDLAAFRARRAQAEPPEDPEPQPAEPVPPRPDQPPAARPEPIAAELFAREAQARRVLALVALSALAGAAAGLLYFILDWVAA
jgi:hypothetical protein